MPLLCKFPEHYEEGLNVYLWLPWLCYFPHFCSLDCCKIHCIYSVVVLPQSSPHPGSWCIIILFTHQSYLPTVFLQLVPPGNSSQFLRFSSLHHQGCLCLKAVLNWPYLLPWGARTGLRCSTILLHARITGVSRHTWTEVWQNSYVGTFFSKDGGTSQ